MTDRLTEIKARLDALLKRKPWISTSPDGADLITPLPDDIAWLIGELEKEREARWSLKFYVKQAIDHFRGSSGLLNETLEALANELRKQPPTSNKT